MAQMKRVALIVLDGVGVGAQHDAKNYGDEGANTLGHVVSTQQPSLPNLTELGLMCAAGLSTAQDDEPIACFGRMEEKAAGKDTTTGHWELAGLVLDKPFPTYPDGFPPEVIRAFEEETGLEVIGNYPASGTQIIEDLGREHLATGKPIVYTSADSVFQIAAHEEVIQVSELWHICRIARRLLKGEHAVGRVIARPFVGTPGNFVRTGNRRDFSIDPAGDTMLDVLRREGFDVRAVGKIEDIFNHRGISKSVHSVGNADCIDAAVEMLKDPKWKGLMFVNLVDTDSLYGHRNDAPGFARALEEIDRRIPEILRLLGDDGMLIITADHGCDPVHPGTDHTREMVPLMVWGLGLKEGADLGTRKSFADVSATILEALGAKGRLAGESFLQDILEDE